MEITGMLSCMNKSPNRHGFRDSTNFACACTNKLSRRLIACVRSVRKGRERGFRARERREERVGSARGARGRNLLSLPWQATPWKRWEHERTGARQGLVLKCKFSEVNNVILWFFIASRTKTKISIYQFVKGVRGSHNFSTDISVAHGIDWNTKATGKISKNTSEKKYSAI